MKEIKCTVIQDILPLYVDEVVSDDTKKIVEEHLQLCESCQKEYLSMKNELAIPAKSKPSLFENFRKKWRKKKIIISLASTLSTAIVLFGLFVLLFGYQRAIPYTNDMIKIEEKNNKLYSLYSGESFVSVKTTHPMEVELNGERKKVSFIFYTDTAGDKWMNRNKKILDARFELPDSEETDAVYYAKYDVAEISSGKVEWDSILDNGVLIWEK